MALNRTMDYVLKNGELTCDVANVATYSFVGGSPVTIDSDGYISANITSLPSIVAIAYHSLTDDDAQEDMSTIIFAPAIVTMEAESDGTKPYKTGVTWAKGNLIRPTVTTGTPAVSIWTNEAWTQETQHYHYIYYGTVLNVEGTATNPTSLKVLFTIVPKIKE